jgi:peptidoglycan/LPS O-acetylase OafA/YrhL
MRKGISIYLDLVRFLAAVGVVISHAYKFVMPSIPWQIAANGGECVAVFFVLSGFMMRYVSVEKGENDWRTYAAARSTRMYSVVLVSLITTLIATHIGYAADPRFYLQNSWYNPQTDLGTAISALTFTNEVWFTHTIFSSAEPFWSLGFEVPYYVFFGLLLFTRGRMRLALMAVWALVFGPKILINLPLWVLGCLTYTYIRKQGDWHRVSGWALMVGSLVAYLLVRFAVHHYTRLMYMPLSLGDMVKGAAYYFVTGVIVAVHFVGADRQFGNRDWNPNVSRAIRWLANGSFTLYLVHLPVMAAVRAWFPGIVQSAASGALAILFIAAVAYVIAEIGERRKHWYKAYAERLFGVPSRKKQAA